MDLDVSGRLDAFDMNLFMQHLFNNGGNQYNG